MFIKKAGNPEIEDLAELYMDELIEAGTIDSPEAPLKAYTYKILSSEAVESYVVMEGGRVACMCCCNIVNMLPLPDVTTRYYFISNLYTVPKYRNTDYENLLVKYVRCEMERRKIKKFEF